MVWREADPDWWRAVWRTFWFALVSVSLETVLGMIVALALNVRFRCAACCARRC